MSWRVVFSGILVWATYSKLNGGESEIFVVLYNIIEVIVTKFDVFYANIYTDSLQ